MPTPSAPAPAGETDAAPSGFDIRSLGPSIVAGIADDDPSAVGTYSHLGAKFGLSLVWAPLLLLPVMAAAQVAAGRIGAAQRRGLAAAAKAELPMWVCCLVFLPVVAAGTLTLGADLHAMASAIQLLVDLPEALLLALLAGGTVGLQIFVGYRRSRRVLQLSALGIASYFGVVLAADVDWSQVLRALWRPTLAADRGGLQGLIAVCGAALSPYVLVWQPQVETEEATLRAAAGLRLRHPREAAIDATVGIAIAMFAGCAILVASAATLPLAGITSVETADQAAQALRPLLGRGAEVVFALGIVAVGLLAVPILAGGAALVTSELFGWRTGIGRRLRDAPGFYSVFLLAVVAGLSLTALGVPPVRALYLASIANGLAAPGLLILLVWLTRSRRAVGGQRIGLFTAALIVFGAALTAALPVLLLVSGA